MVKIANRYAALVQIINVSFSREDDKNLSGSFVNSRILSPCKTNKSYLKFDRDFYSKV
jgi:hypothetical protein